MSCTMARTGVYRPVPVFFTARALEAAGHKGGRWEAFLRLMFCGKQGMGCYCHRLWAEPGGMPSNHSEFQFIFSSSKDLHSLSCGTWWFKASHAWGPLSSVFWCGREEAIGICFYDYFCDIQSCPVFLPALGAVASCLGKAVYFKKKIKSTSIFPKSPSPPRPHSAVCWSRHNPVPFPVGDNFIRK